MENNTIWFDKSLQLPPFTSISSATMAEHLGMEWVELGPDFLSIRMPVDHRTHQPYGLLHGGARYPITHRQFQAFVDAGGYGQEAWWAGLAERPDPISAQWTEPNVPRERVSWYEATAFCRWLDAGLRAAGELPEGWQVSLPTEVQWERAAGGEIVGNILGERTFVRDARTSMKPVVLVENSR